MKQAMIKDIRTAGAGHDEFLQESKRSEDLVNKYGESTIIVVDHDGFCRAYGSSALRLNETLGITLYKYEDITYAEFPKRCEDIYYPKCIRDGYKLAIITND